TYDRVVAHPKYAELMRKRNRFALTLSAIVLGVYYSFVLVATMAPSVFSSPLSEGMTWCVGLLAGFIIQAFAFVMTGIYVRRANGEFDSLNRTLIEETAR
ncbi:MAG: DUF485 domain-containing protein, partial [Magnetospirillum sp.]|nr:DUF485 domain-containing protein [Magnetospirillum sp.]